MIFGLEQLTCLDVREFNRTMGKVVVCLTQKGHTINIIQSSQANYYSKTDTQRLRSEIRDGATGNADLIWDAPSVCCEYHWLIKDCLGPVQREIEAGEEN